MTQIGQIDGLLRSAIDRGDGGAVTLGEITNGHVAFKRCGLRLGERISHGIPGRAISATASTLRISARTGSSAPVHYQTFRL